MGLGCEFEQRNALSLIDIEYLRWTGKNRNSLAETPVGIRQVKMHGA
jgi:hypothetical protein